MSQEQNQHRPMDELIASEQRYRELVEHIREIIFQCTFSGELLFLNASWSKTLGYTLNESLGRNLFDFILEEDVPVIKRLFERDIICVQESQSCDVRFRMKNGELLWMLFSIRKGVDGDYIGSLYNINQNKIVENSQKQLNESLELRVRQRTAELEKLNFKLERLSLQDALTGQPNRRLLFDRLQQTIVACSRFNYNNALFFIDIDDFKNINDSYGHNYGDLLLKEVANRIKYSVRESDTLARFAGDEFVVITPNLDTDRVNAANQARGIAEKITAALSKPYQLKEIQYQGSVSIGIVLFSDSEETDIELLKQADIAMYKAKQAGKNTVCFFDPQMQDEILEQAELENSLKKAIREQEFELYYQPQIGTFNQTIGAEALIRWRHPSKGIVSPDDFIPIAEETGLIVAIGEWVLRSAFQQLSVWQQRTETAHLSLSVNVSAKQFRDPGFIPLVFQLMGHYQISRGKLRLELTETMLVEDMEQTISHMNALRDIGIHFSLDDFGTGYSSLRYLQQLPLSQLKIDRSFVDKLESDMSDQSIVKTIISMTDALGLYTVAEGVETIEQRKFLESRGCRAYQGFLYSRPLPLDEFEYFLAENTELLNTNNLINM